MLPPIENHELLNSEASAPGLIALYQRVMQHRTIEAMNGLSNRLDGMLDQAGRNAVAQSKQQRTMATLTFVIALATVAYTATTIYATRAAAHGPQMVYVSSAGQWP